MEGRRLPEIGDLGVIINDYRSGDATTPVEVESLNEGYAPRWIADFDRDELEFVREYLDGE